MGILPGFGFLSESGEPGFLPLAPPAGEREEPGEEGAVLLLLVPQRNRGGFSPSLAQGAEAILEQVGGEDGQGGGEEGEEGEPLQELAQAGRQPDHPGPSASHGRQATGPPLPPPSLRCL